MMIYDWMTLDEGANHLRVSRPTLDRWIAEQRVRAYELPSGRGRRVKRDDLDELLVQPRRTLRELQPRMAEFAVYTSGNDDFRTLAIMVRDASADQAAWSRQVVEKWVSQAEASNPRDTFRGRLVRQARLALMEWVDDREKRLSR
jgi:excisionase family DNA binding protein